MPLLAQCSMIQIDFEFVLSINQNRFFILLLLGHQKNFDLKGNICRKIKFYSFIFPQCNYNNWMFSQHRRDFNFVHQTNPELSDMHTQARRNFSCKMFTHFNTSKHYFFATPLISKVANLNFELKSGVTKFLNYRALKSLEDTAPKGKRV